MKYGYKVVLFIIIFWFDLILKNLIFSFYLVLYVRFSVGILLVRYVGNVVVCLYIF